ncbi:MAG: Rieske 2Fe-2S domain-containing protein [Chloroflexi bacterium]|nr:Rieske 2Fe-2S domain-containing protein [Chloroflexota bacterium]
MNTTAAINVAAADEVQEGRILALYVQDTPLALTRVTGQVRAFGDICTHDGGPLAEGEIIAGCVVCPRHGARFDLTTGKPTFPAVYKVPIYAAEEKDGRIWVIITPSH